MELRYTLSREELTHALTLINQKNFNRAGYHSLFCLLYGIAAVLASLRLAAATLTFLPVAAGYLLAAVLAVCLCKWAVLPLAGLTVKGIIRLQVKGKWGRLLCGSHHVAFSEQSAVLDGGKPFFWIRAYYVIHADDLLLVTGRRGRLLVCSFAGLSLEEQKAYCDYLDQYVYLLEEKDA